MRLVVRIALILQLVVVFAFWLWNQSHSANGNLLSKSVPELLEAIGRLAALTAACAILLQLMLIGRARWLERHFGLDRLIWLHQKNGFFLAGALVAHPILTVAGHALKQHMSAWAQLEEFFTGWDDVRWAMAAWLLIVAVVVVSHASIRRRFRYERWHAAHLALYVAIALAFLHQPQVGRDFTTNRVFAAYWYCLYAFVIANLGYYRLFLPIRLYWRHRFVVTRLKRETDSVTSVWIRGRNLSAFRIEAGQFMLVRFWAKGLRWQSHPFSISLHPDGNEIRLTIKNVGDFTASISQLQAGTPVIIDGPHGVFTAKQSRRPSVLMIAGGIGITPIRSLLERLVAIGKDVVVLYCNRTAGEIVFRDELAELEASHPQRLRVVHIISQDPSWGGEKGRLDWDKLRRIAPRASDSDVFLCGPPAMIQDLLKVLTAVKVPTSAIHWERFSF